MPATKQEEHQKSKAINDFFEKLHLEALVQSFHSLLAHIAKVKHNASDELSEKDQEIKKSNFFKSWVKYFEENKAVFDKILKEQLLQALINFYYLAQQLEEILKKLQDLLSEINKALLTLSQLLAENFDELYKKLSAYVDPAKQEQFKEVFDQFRNNKATINDVTQCVVQLSKEAKFDKNENIEDKMKQDDSLQSSISHHKKIMNATFELKEIGKNLKESELSIYEFKARNNQYNPESFKSSSISVADIQQRIDANMIAIKEASKKISDQYNPVVNLSSKLRNVELEVKKESASIIESVIEQQGPSHDLNLQQDTNSAEFSGEPDPLVSGDDIFSIQDDFSESSDSVSTHHQEKGEAGVSRSSADDISYQAQEVSERKEGELHHSNSKSENPLKDPSDDLNPGGAEEVIVASKSKVDDYEFNYEDEGRPHRKEGELYYSDEQPGSSGENEPDYIAEPVVEKNIENKENNKTSEHTTEPIPERENDQVKAENKKHDHSRYTSTTAKIIRYKDLQEKFAAKEQVSNGVRMEAKDQAQADESKKLGKSSDQSEENKFDNNIEKNTKKSPSPEISDTSSQHEDSYSSIRRPGMS